MLRKWWWIPLAMLAVLFVKAWFVAGMVQDSARELAADAAGIPLVNVEIHDGLNVRLTGFADEATRDQAVAAVDELDSSWEVEGTLDEPAAPAAVEPEPEPEPEPDAAAVPAPATAPALTITVATSGAIVLDGTVATDEIRAAMVDQANQTYGAANVTDNLLVDPDAVADEGGTMTITGLAETAGQRLEWVAAAEGVAAKGGLTLTDEIDVAQASVEDQLNALFELEPIEFDTSRATIRSTSEATLATAAEVINANPEPGRLRVVGHTDSDGSDRANLDLSQRRAQAVIDYLVETGDVDPERLEAEGRGETELEVQPEETPEDKQRNRRIEWEPIS